MRPQLRFDVVILAFLAGSGIAVAQHTPGDASGLDLTADQQHVVNQGLSGQQVDHSQAAAQTQVGGKLPDAVHTNPMPDRVATNVPPVKNLLFVRLPDRVLLINPDEGSGDHHGHWHRRTPSSRGQ